MHFAASFIGKILQKHQFNLRKKDRTFSKFRSFANTYRLLN